MSTFQALIPREPFRDGFRQWLGRGCGSLGLEGVLAMRDVLLQWLRLLCEMLNPLPVPASEQGTCRGLWRPPRPPLGLGPGAWQVSGDRDFCRSFGAARASVCIDF